jgi:hypothetical protein
VHFCTSPIGATNTAASTGPIAGDLLDCGVAGIVTQPAPDNIVEQADLSKPSGLISRRSEAIRASYGAAT